MDPESYLRDVLVRLPGSSTNPDELRKLLPENWAAAHKPARFETVAPTAA